MTGRSTCGSARTKGFTLVELLVALAVLALLVSMAAPSFRDTLADVYLTGEQNRLVKGLRQARAEAIKRVRPVTLCHSADGASCGGSLSDGWLLYVDSAAAGTVGTLDADDEIIAVHRAAPGRYDITATARIRPDPVGTVSSVRFGPRGRADWTLGTFVLCDARGADVARAIILNGAGGLRSEEPDGGPTADAAGNPVTCS